MSPKMGLSISGLTLELGDKGARKTILRGIDLEVPSGAITGLAGESGSGKTMTGLAICGLHPIVALARQPWPNALPAQLMSSVFRIGPWTITRGEAICVEHCIPFRLKLSPTIASSAAMTTGMYSGLHPAITAFAATRSTVASPPKGSSVAIRSSAARPLASMNLFTSSRAGGTVGSPSVQPASNMSSETAP